MTKRCIYKTKHYVYNGPFTMMDKNGKKYVLKVEQDYFAQSPREWDNVCSMICFSERHVLGDTHDFSSPFDFLQHLYHDVTGKYWCDEHGGDDWRDVYEALLETDLIVIKLINMYEHGGITISTSNSYPFNDRWDSSVVGFVYVTKKTIFDNGCCLCEKDENGDYILVEHKHDNVYSTYSHKTIPTTDDNWKEVADSYIEDEMETYDQYLQGNVYGYILTHTVTERTKCPHCGEIIDEYETEEEDDNCWGFCGDCLEENGIFDSLGLDLCFAEEG